MLDVMMFRNFEKDNNSTAWYLLMEKVAPMKFAGVRFFTWLIVFSQVVPVSLLVSLEMARFVQGKIMEADPNMQKTYTVGRQTKTKSCNVQNSEMNEDLGRVEFVFSDKTGTLTENVLDFRQLLVAGNKPKGGGYTQIAWTNLVARGEFDDMEASADGKVYSLQTKKVKKHNYRNFTENCILVSKVIICWHINTKIKLALVDPSSFS